MFCSLNTAFDQSKTASNSYAHRYLCKNNGVNMSSRDYDDQLNVDIKRIKLNDFHHIVQKQRSVCSMTEKVWSDSAIFKIRQEWSRSSSNLQIL